MKFVVKAGLVASAVEQKLTGFGGGNADADT
jgi:hypothetical protein